MHHDFVLTTAHDARRNLDLGNLPKAKSYLDALIEQAEKEKIKVENPKSFLIKELQPAMTLPDAILKINELIRDRNQKHR